MSLCDCVVDAAQSRYSIFELSDEEPVFSFHSAYGFPSFHLFPRSDVADEMTEVECVQSRIRNINISLGLSVACIRVSMIFCSDALLSNTIESPAERRRKKSHHQNIHFVCGLERIINER